jgi:hypothetical protein
VIIEPCGAPFGLPDREEQAVDLLVVAQRRLELELLVAALPLASPYLEHDSASSQT